MSVGAIGLGIASIEYATALKESVRGVVPQYVTQNVPHVVNSTITNMTQKFVPGATNFLINAYPNALNVWNLSYNSTTQVNVLLQPVTNFYSSNGGWMAQFLVEVVKYTAQFGGGAASSTLAQFPLTMGAGQSTIIPVAGGNATQIIFDGLQTTAQGQSDNVFTVINGHMQNVTSIHTQSVIQYVQDKVLANSQALSLVHNHVLPLVNQLTAIGEVAVAAGIVGLLAIGISKLRRKSNGSGSDSQS